MLKSKIITLVLLTTITLTFSLSYSTVGQHLTPAEKGIINLNEETSNNTHPKGTSIKFVKNISDEHSKETLEKSIIASGNHNGSNLVASANSYSVPVGRVNQMLNGTYRSPCKMVFLTFDDGPSEEITPTILNILEQNGVHATFFVLGSRLNSNTNKNILKRMYYNGNAIGNHTVSHNFRALYPNNSVSVSNFMNDVHLNNNILQSILGNNFYCSVLRMPGGYLSRQYYNDKNLPNLNAEMNNNGVVSIDWNAETGDATEHNYTPKQLVANAINESYNRRVVVLLMHDVKYNTATALPDIIKYYKNNGYNFMVISN